MPFLQSSHSAEYPPTSWQPVEEFLALLATMTSEQRRDSSQVLTLLAAEIQRDTQHLPQPAPAAIREFLAEYGAPAS